MDFATIYGYIKIDGDYNKSIDFVKGLGKDKSYPNVSTDMFSFGDTELPYYYDSIIWGFATTYRRFGFELEHWNLFILKIENILRNIDFENSQLHIESQIGDYTLFWTRQGPSHPGEEMRKYIEEYNLTKTDEWYFGFGKRDPFTGYTETVEFYEDLRNEPTLNFKYPISL